MTTRPVSAWRGWLGAIAAAGLALLAAAVAAPARAQEPLPVPALSGRVVDTAGTLSAAQQQALDGKLAALERETGSQVVVLLVPTTAPEDIAAYAQRVADQWKIGRSAVGDGVLLVSAQQDRRVRIEVAKTLEGAIPDLAASRIIDQQIRPAFRTGDFAGGLNQAVDQLAARIRGEALPAPAPTAAERRAADAGPDWGELGMFFFVGVPLVGAFLTAGLGRKLGSLATGAATGLGGWWLTASVLLGAVSALLAVVFVGVLGIGAARGGGGGSRSLGRRGGQAAGPVIWGGSGGGFGGGGGWSGSGGGGGGGFSSGGGGDFGGGGASGDW